MFKLPVQQSLQYTMVTPVVGVIAALACAYFIDITGRKPWFSVSFLLGSLPLFVLAFGGADSAFNVMLMSTLSWFFITTISLGLYLYSAEIYPTRIRSRGTGFAAGASKAGGVAIIALVTFGIAAPSIATVALIGAIPMTLAVILMLAFGVETRKRRLEEITRDEFARAA